LHIFATFASILTLPKRW